MLAFYLSFLFLPCALGIERIYYIGIKEEIWDYAPSGMNLITGVKLENDSDASVFYTNGPTRIGRRYKKALYRQYSDDTFTTEIPKDPTLGLLGPTIVGEVGDVIIIHAKNFASRNYSLHPHGVQYLKNSEGAVYTDGVSYTEKVVMPGQTKNITWTMEPQFGPTEFDPSCATYIYHSHVDTMRDTYSGLLGGMLVCKPGTLGENDSRNDVDRYYILNFYVIDENLSWYLDDNIKAYCSGTVDKTDADFQESNIMHGINGLGYGNLQGLFACEGERVGWNVFGFGNEVDIHSAQFEQQTIISSSHRQDTINLFAAVFKSLTMEAANPGISMISCRVNDHYSAGMYTSLNVSSGCGTPVDSGSTNPVKTLYIAIEEHNWNYAPTGNNTITGQSLTAAGTDSETFFVQNEERIGGTYKKALFIGYEDSSFTIKIPTANEMGLLGPLIAVEVGDVIAVTLKNTASRAYNIEPHGLLFTDTSAVQPGDTRTFTWRAPDSVAPTDIDSNCITYLYTSGVDPVKDTNSGLVGPLLLCKRGTLAAALARDAYYFLFTVLDENLSHYLEENVQTFATSANATAANKTSIDVTDEDFMESNLMHSINGLMYGNLLNISLCVGKETDFHVIGLGTEVDMHSLFASGVNIRVRNENTGVMSVFPQTTSSATVFPTAVGTGEIRCVVVDHLLGGMITSYSVSEVCAAYNNLGSGKVRYFNIAVVEEDWDYVNNSKVDTLGRSLGDPNTPGYTFVHQQTGAFIGSVYKKAIYYEYEDTDFKVRKNKPAHLGVMGPVIGGEVGDTIKITFKNMASRRYSITPWGAKGKLDPFNSDRTGVNPGQTKTFEWVVPLNAVPPTGQPGCNSWIYKSNVDEVKDVYSGLIGPLLLCRSGFYNGNSGTVGYDEDFHLLFFIFDENQSHYLDENIRTFTKADPSTFDKASEAFQESNLMHGINGIIYQLSGLETSYNDDVLWHLIGYGNEVDIHTAHFHAHAFTYVSDITSHDDVFELFPGKIGTVVMKTTEPGTWLLHCHVDDHIEAGMITTFKVNEKATTVVTDQSLEGWEIALIVVGSVAGIVIIGFIAYMIQKRSRSGRMA